MGFQEHIDYFNEKRLNQYLSEQDQSGDLFDLSYGSPLEAGESYWQMDEDTTVGDNKRAIMNYFGYLVDIQAIDEVFEAIGAERKRV